MTRDRIAYLSGFLPQDNGYFPFPENFATGEHQSERKDRIVDFTRYYSVLSFGWGFVRTLRDYDLPLPNVLLPEEDPLYRAYMFESGITDDTEVCWAIDLAQGYNQFEAGIIQGLLLSEDGTIEGAAERTGIPVEVIRIYEQLFYNIVDRRNEWAWVAKQLYPRGRVGAAVEEYTSAGHIDLLLKRSGHENGMADVVWASGLKTKFHNELSGHQAAQSLETLIMVNGYFLAKNGMINNKQVLSDSRNLLTAAKQSGVAESNIPDEDISNFSDSLSNHMFQYANETFSTFKTARTGPALEESNPDDSKE